MANVGGRQLTLGALKHIERINPVLQNGTFLQNPGLEPSDLAIPWAVKLGKAELENIGRASLANLGSSFSFKGFSL